MAQDFVDVLIPLASHSGRREGAICEIRASRNARPTERRGGLHPVIAPLAEVRLAAPGQRALDAVRRLPLPPRRWLSDLRLTRPQPALSQLSPLDVRQAQGLDPANAKSAELGLATALALLERGGAGKTFFATGTLDGRPGAVAGNNGAVGPVAGLTQKFAAIADWLESHRIGAWGRSAVVLVPPVTEDGRTLVEAHAEDLDALRTRAAAAGVSVDIRPTDSLAAATRGLGATRPPLGRREWAARSGLVAALVAAAVLVSAAQPMPVAPAPVQLLDTPPAPSPVVLAQGLSLPGAPPVFLPRPTCFDAEGLPVVPFGSRVVAEFQTAPTRWPLGLVHPLYVSIGEHSEPKAFTSAQFEQLSAQNALAPEDSTGPVAPLRRADGRLRLGAGIGVRDTAQEAKFVLLLRKLTRHDPEAVVDGLVEAAAGVGAEARLSAQAAFLASLPGSYAEVSYRAMAAASVAELGCQGALQ